MNLFAGALEGIPVATISACLPDCPRRTIYAWKSGERLPPLWVRKLVIKAIAQRTNYCPPAKVH